MASDTRLSDDDIRAAARVWFRNFGSGFRSLVDDLKPGVFREMAPQFAHDFPTPNRIRFTRNLRLFSAKWPRLMVSKWRASREKTPG